MNNTEDIRYKFAGFHHDEKIIKLSKAYHVTSITNLSNIKINGIIPNKPSQNEPEVVYLTESIYGAIVLSKLLFDNKKIKSDYIILEINTIDMTLYKDPFSIKEQGLYCYSAIPPENIKTKTIIDYDIVKTNKNFKSFWNWWFWKKEKPEFIKKFNIDQYYSKKIMENKMKTFVQFLKEQIINPFKSSKIKIPLYHGTSKDFDKFDKSMLGSYTGAKDVFIGFHFTDNKKIADLFGISEKTKIVFINSKKPFNLVDDVVGTEDIKKLNELFFIIFGQKHTNKNDELFEDFSNEIQDGLSFDYNSFKSEVLTDHKVLTRLKKLGYDSLILPLTHSDQLLAGNQQITDVSGSEYIVFEPEQIIIIGNKNENI